LATETIPEAAKTDSITKAIADNKKAKPKKQPQDTTKTTEIEQQEFRTFSVFGYVAPTYFNHFAQKSSIDKRLDSLPGRSEVVFNYGAYLCFNYNERWTVRFGAARTVLRYTTEGVRINSPDGTPANTQNFYHVDYAGSISNTSLAETFSASEFMDIEQEMTYTEVPIELKYKLLKGTVTIEAIGGFSALFLNENTVSAISENNGTVAFGSTKDASAAHFSANLGIGFSYRFARNLSFNAEPMFRFHIKQTPIMQQSYRLLLQTGIEYTFNSKKRTKRASK
jgi:hypothetical protein